MRKVVVTGLGCLSPIGNNVEESWHNACRAQSGIDTISLFDPARLTVQIAGEVKNFDPLKHMPAKDIKKTNRFIQLAIAASHEAIYDSGFDMEKQARENFGCSLGVGIGAIDYIDKMAITRHEQGPKRVSPFFIPSVITNMAAGQVSMTHKLKGPNLCSTTACTSSTHAIGEGYLYIKNNMADIMLCGGSEAAICELGIAGFANMKALSRSNETPKQASRPFDQNRNGFVMGEGSAQLVLEDYEHAKKRGAKIYCEILGYGASADAHHITSPAPKGEGFVRCMKSALKSAKVNPEQIDYINAHGTSTYYNDLFESQAIEEVFSSYAKKLAISSTKGVTGHCLGAAGSIEALLTSMAIKNSVLPPTANLDTPDPNCRLDYVPKEARTKDIKIALSNSFGFGGTNATLVLGKV